jgi:hypothetical protein
MNAEHMSDIAKAIEAEGRFVRCVPMPDFFGPTHKASLVVAYRVAVKGEEDDAIVAAHKYAQEAAKNAGDAAGAAARADADLLGDAKNIEALYRVCREAEQDGKGGWRLKEKAKPDGSGDKFSYSAFPSPSWMRARLSTDQLAYLMNAYIAVRAEASPGGPDEVSEDQHEALVTLCAEHWNDDLPDAVLNAFSRPRLTNAFVLLTRKLVEARTARDALLEERATWEAERAELVAAAHREPEGGEGDFLGTTPDDPPAPDGAPASAAEG